MTARNPYQPWPVSWFLGGLAFGVGLRVAMRIAAIAGGIPTEFTVEGTMFVLMAATFLGGVIGGLIAWGLNLIRPLRRFHAAGPLAMLLLFSALMGPEGYRELREVGLLWLNLLTFGGSAVLAGIVIDYRPAGRRSVKESSVSPAPTA